MKNKLISVSHDIKLNSEKHARSIVWNSVLGHVSFLARDKTETPIHHQINIQLCNPLLLKWSRYC